MFDVILQEFDSEPIRLAWFETLEEAEESIDRYIRNRMNLIADVEYSIYVEES